MLEIAFFAIENGKPVLAFVNSGRTDATKFGVLDLETTFEGCRFSIGVRNANDKSMRLAMTVGYRVFVCDNMAFHGDFTPVLAKHTKRFSLVDAVSVGRGSHAAELRADATPSRNLESASYPG